MPRVRLVREMTASATSIAKGERWRQRTDVVIMPAGMTSL